MKSIFSIQNIIIAGLIFCSQTLIGQQESQYTQFMNNKLYYNPAFAGNNGTTSITALFRRQWIGFDGAPESKLISASLPLIDNRVGLGIQASVHELGVTKNWYLSMAYSYNLKINDDSNLRLGIHGTMRRLLLDFSKQSLIIQDRTDGSILAGSTSADYYGNIGGGAYYNNKQFYASFSIPNLLENNLSLTNGLDLEQSASEARHYYLMTGMTFVANPKISIQPNILFKYVKNAPFDVDLNLSVIYDQRITGGISYRAGGDRSGGESIDFLLAYKMEQFTVGVSYDFAISEIGRETSGSFEVVARFDLPKKLVNRSKE